VRVRPSNSKKKQERRMEGSKIKDSKHKGWEGDEMKKGEEAERNNMRRNGGIEDGKRTGGGGGGKEQ
jgi:hypothetical protein